MLRTRPEHARCTGPATPWGRALAGLYGAALVAAVMLALPAASPALAQDRPQAEAGGTQPEADDVQWLDIGPSSRRVIVLPRNRERIVHLRLNDALRMALENNLDVQIVGVDVRSAQTERVAARSIFDPILIGGGLYGVTRQPGVFNDEIYGGTGLAASQSYMAQVSVGISQLLPTAALASLEYTYLNLYNPNSGVYTINPWRETSLTLSVMQPLLKNAGVFYTYSPIVLARKGTEIAEELLDAQVALTLKDTSVAYWKLLGALGNLHSAWVARDRAEELLSVVQQRVRAGVLPQSDLAQAEAELAQRELDISVEELAVLQAEDGLKKLLNMGDVSNILSDASIQPLDRPRFREVELNLSKLELSALTNRPELTASALEAETASIMIKVAERENLPQLDLSVYAGVIGGGGTIDSAHSSMDQADYYQAGVGLSLTIPLGLREGRAKVRQARTQYVQSSLNHSSLRRLIVQEVRFAYTNVKTYRNRIMSTRKIRKARISSLQDVEIGFREGTMTVLDVVTAQERLAEAERELINGLVNYETSLVELEYASGRLLQTNRIGKERGRQQ